MYAKPARSPHARRRSVTEPHGGPKVFIPSGRPWVEELVGVTPSNALGTINPVEQIVKKAHEAGTLVYIDAVQYAPHGPIDVQKLDCDFLISSAYKFFGLHTGILYGKQELLEKLFAYKVRPATNRLPGKFETGTQNHECIAGVLGAIEYFEWVGRQFGSEFGGRERLQETLLKIASG